ncbi:MAG: DNA circularization N-terminal domain-containing protein, partial [Methanomicrobiaceae archaeon]|nr:DNA circularization N-terminal domain-containing protein [Methanomicrobiaceae archaeon]
MDLIVGNIPLITVKYNEDPTKAPTMVRQIGEIRTTDTRMLVEHEIPGMQGNVFQDMGRGSVRISFSGTFYGRNATDDMSTLRQYYLAGKPVFFYSDFSTISDIVNVVIDFLEITKFVGERNKLEYSIVLREFPSQPPEDVPPGSQDEDAKEWANGLVDDIAPEEEEEGAEEEGTGEETAEEEGAEEEGTGEETAEEEGAEEEGTGEETAEEEEGAE